MSEFFQTLEVAAAKVSKHLKFSFSLAATALFLACAGRSAEVTHDEMMAALKKTAAYEERVGLVNFTAEFRCVEVESMLALQMAMLQISAKPRFELVSLDGKQSGRLVLDGFPDAMTQQLDQKLRGRFALLYRAIERSTVWATFFTAIPDTASLDLISATDRSLEFEINGVNEPFMNRALRSMRVRIDRVNSIFEMTSADFGDGQKLSAVWTSKAFEVPGQPQKIWIPVRYEMTQHGLNELRAVMPEKFSVTIENIHILTAADRAALLAKTTQREQQLKKLREDLLAAGVATARVAAIAYSQSGTLELNLKDDQINNIAFLSGLPVTRFEMNRSGISDLSAFSNAPIQTLHIPHSKVADLGPLRHTPLHVLTIYESPVTDLAPLAECASLQRLHIGNCPVTMIQPVAKLPLLFLDLSGTKIRDLSSLAECRTLESLRLPSAATNIETLRGLTNLQWISFAWNPTNSRPAKSAAEFWAEFDHAKKN